MMPVSRNDMVAEEKGRRARERKEMNEEEEKCSRTIESPQSKNHNQFIDSDYWKSKRK